MAAALALSGCQVSSPQQTTVPYQPADGVNVTLGDVKVSDLVVVTSAKGTEGVLSGQVINNGPQAATVTYRHRRRAAADHEGRRPLVQPSSPVTAGVSPVTLPTVTVEPGSMLDLTIGSSAAGTDQIGSAVLLPDRYYSTHHAPPRRPPAATTT